MYKTRSPLVAAKPFRRWEPSMEREYDLFEVSEGTLLWRCRVSGLENARLKLHELVKSTDNECFMINLQTREVIIRLNVGVSHKTKPVVFLISYDERLAPDRTEVLRKHGFEVVSVVGNDSAKGLLNLPLHIDLFIVGHAASEEVRKEMVAWLKMKFPSVQILALNPPTILELDGADYNVKLDGPETWLPVVSGALREQRGGEPKKN